MTRITLANILVCLAVGAVFGWRLHYYSPKYARLFANAVVMLAVSAWLGWTFTVALGQAGRW